MMKAIIVDDEYNNAEYLSSLIQEHLPQVKLEGVAFTVKEGVSLIKKINPDLVFLDIELQTATGFDLLHELGTIDFSVIFTTAHEQYALRAIKFAALDYLLKPVDPEELIQSVQKAVRRTKNELLNKNMDVFFNNFKKQNEQKKIAISTSSGIIVMDIKDILYMQSDGPYTNIYSRHDEKIMSSKHLKEYEELLGDYGFFRIHKSFLVNLTEIKHYARSDGGYVTISNGDRVDVSDKKKQDLITQLSSQVIFSR